VSNDVNGVSRPESSVCSSIRGKDAWRIFQEHDAGSKFANNTPELRPHIALIIGSFSLSGFGVWLAGESTAEHVTVGQVVPSGVSDVSETQYVGPMSRKHFVAEVVIFHLYLYLKARPFEGEIKPADT
jgi:hypothetical protein